MENSTGKRYLKQIWRFAPSLWYFYCPVPHAWLAECAGLMVLKLTISTMTGLTPHKLSHTEMFALVLGSWAYAKVLSALFDQYTWVVQGAGFTLRLTVLCSAAGLPCAAARVFECAPARMLF